MTIRADDFALGDLHEDRGPRAAARVREVTDVLPLVPQVIELENHRVRFTAGEDSEELILKVLPGPKTTLAAAPPAPGAPVAAAAAPAAAAARAAQAAQAQAAPINPAVPEQPTSRAARRAARGAAAGQGTDAQIGTDMGSGQQGRGGQRRSK